MVNKTSLLAKLRQSPNIGYIAIIAICAVVFAAPVFFDKAKAIFVSSPQDPILTGDITSNMILDGTIVNLDVSSSTGINFQKISTSTAVYPVTDQAQTFAGVKTFSSLPQTTAGDPVADNDLTRKAYVDANAGRATLSVYMADTLAAGTAVFLATSTIAASTQESYIVTDNAIQTCTGNTEEGFFQGFTVGNGGRIDSIDVRLADKGTYNADVKLELRKTNGRQPTTEVIASTTIPAAQITTTPATTTLGIYPPFVAMGSTTLAIVIRCTANGTDPNVLGLGADGNDDYASGQTGIYNASNGTWSTREDQLSFKVNLLAVEQDKGYAAHGVQASVASSTIGILNVASATSTNANVIVTGANTLFNGLTSGNRWYLSFMAGIATTSTRESAELLYRAISTTTVIVKSFIER